MNTILNSLFYVSGYEFGSECFLGVFSNNINEVIEEDMKEHPMRSRSQKRAQFILCMNASPQKAKKSATPRCGGGMSVLRTQGFRVS